MIEEQDATVRPEEIRECLERILVSKYFVNAHKKKEFLRLVCEFHLNGRANELSEYMLGYEVFARDKKYNPSDDPIVRVLAHEIRKKLDSYYGKEGINDPIRLSIPPGTYKPVFSHRTLQTASEHNEEDEAAQSAEVAIAPRRFSRPTLVLSVATICLSLALLALVVSYFQLRSRLLRAEATRDPSAYGDLWAPFLSEETPTLVILSNPPVLRFTNPSDPESLVKDAIPLAPETVKALEDKFVTNPEVSIEDPNSEIDPGAKHSRAVIERTRTPRLILSTNVLTGMGEAIGLHYLTDLFRKAGASIVLKQSRTLTAEDLKKHNVILLGGGWVNEWFGKLTKTEDFVFTSRGTIENRRVLGDEEKEYIPKFDTFGSLIEDYGLITIKPNISESNEVMLLAGIYSQGTEAASEYVTNKSYLDQLNQRLKQSRNSGQPLKYFQVLLKVGVENGIPTRSSVLAIHELILTSP
jgi:hypothetical protein